MQDQLLPGQSQVYADVELWLRVYGWQRGEPIPQYLRNGDPAEDEIVFSREDFRASVFTLNPLIDRHNERYAVWGFYEEGVLTRWGRDQFDLRTFLADTFGERREFQC